MDFIGGIDLATYISDMKYNNTPINFEDMMKIVYQITSTVIILHQNKITHMDIKPANIMIDPKTLNIRLVDLGLSCLKSSGCNYTGGSPYYMPDNILYTHEGREAADRYAISIIIEDISEDIEDLTRKQRQILYSLIASLQN
jgi:serine/threonine protein kinase